MRFVHPEKWGNDWYMNEEGIPFKLVDEYFIEQPPVSVPKDWKPTKIKRSDYENSKAIETSSKASKS